MLSQLSIPLSNSSLIVLNFKLTVFVLTVQLDNSRWPAWFQETCNMVCTVPFLYRFACSRFSSDWDWALAMGLPDLIVCSWNGANMHMQRCQSSTKITTSASPVGKVHVSSTCLKLFWTSLKFSKQPNEPWTFFLPCLPITKIMWLKGEERRIIVFCLVLVHWSDSTK